MLDDRDARCGVGMFTQSVYSVFQERVVIAMVGLPARGKSYISKAIVRYLNFVGCPTQLFNAGNMRRQHGLAGTDASFFDPANKSAQDAKEAMAMDCLDLLLGWLHDETAAGGSACAILDATNTTVARRRKVIQRCKREAENDAGLRLLFVESVTDDEVILNNNFRMKLDNEDYIGADPAAALADFKARVAQYEKVYQPVCDETDGEETRYVKIIDAGRKLVSKNVEGKVQRKVQRLLGSIHLAPRKIWLALVGETRHSTEGILGGDTSLTAEGVAYARGVSELLLSREREGGSAPATIICGSLKRYVAMAEILCATSADGEERPAKRAKAELCQNCLRRGCGGECMGGRRRRLMVIASANELSAGALDSLTQTEIQQRFPREYEARKSDKFNYRYPGCGGESYADLVARLNELICSLESMRGNALVICDRAVFRVIQSYFDGTPSRQMPYLEIKPGLLEMGRSHSGFAATQLDVAVGAATNVSGPGTQAAYQRPPLAESPKMNASEAA